MNIAIVATAAVIGVLIGILCLINNVDRSNRPDTDIQQDKAVQEYDDKAWKAAYHKILLDYQDPIETFEYPEYGDPRPSTALCDINGDGVQELFFMAKSDFVGSGELYVFTYRDGRTVELDVPYPQGIMSSETEDGRFMYVNAASGTNYAIFKRSGNRFVICGIIGDEGSEKVICDYTMDEKLNITRDYWIEKMSLNWDDYNGQYMGKNYEYWHKTEPIDREELSKREQHLADDMEQIIFTNVIVDWEDIILSKADQQKSIALFCADMIRNIAVAEDTRNSTVQKDEYRQVLEEYKDAFALVRSGSDYDRQANTMKHVPKTFMSGVANYIAMSDSVDLHMQYSENDLNGDGTKELIVGCKDGNYDETVIDSIFAVDKGGKVQRIISCDSFMYRATIAIYDDGTIENGGSSGADVHGYYFYKLKPSKAKLDLIEELEQNGNSYTNNGKEMSESDFWDMVRQKEEKSKMKLKWMRV